MYEDADGVQRCGKVCSRARKLNRLLPAMQGVSHGVLEAVARDTICARAGQFSSKEIPRQAAFHHSYTERG